MTRKQLELIREWILAEIEVAIVRNGTDSEGYAETGYFEKMKAKKLFEDVEKRCCKELVDFEDLSRQLIVLDKGEDSCS
jgi:hypothetical protein